jgi:hypothetical protein
VLLRAGLRPALQLVNSSSLSRAVVIYVVTHTRTRKLFVWNFIMNENTPVHVVYGIVMNPATPDIKREAAMEMLRRLGKDGFQNIKPKFEKKLVAFVSN